MTAERQWFNPTVDSAGKMPTTLGKPVFTYDAKSNHNDCNDPELLKWLEDHDVTPSDCYLIVVYELAVIAHLFSRDEDGRLVVEFDGTGQVGPALSPTVVLPPTCPVPSLPQAGD